MKKIIILMVLALCFAACHKKQQEATQEAKPTANVQIKEYGIIDSLDETCRQLYLILAQSYPAREERNLDNILSWADRTQDEFLKYESSIGFNEDEAFDDYIRCLKTLQYFYDNIDSLDELAYSTADIVDIVHMKLPITEYYAATVSNIILEDDTTFYKEMEAWWEFKQCWEQYVSLWARASVYGGSMMSWYGGAAIVPVRELRGDDLIRTLATMRDIPNHDQPDKEQKAPSLAMADQEFRQCVADIVRGFENWYNSKQLIPEDEYSRKGYGELLNEAIELKNQVLASYKKWYQVRTALELNYDIYKTLSHGQFSKSFYDGRTACLIQDLTKQLNGCDYWWTKKEYLEGK